MRMQQPRGRTGVDLSLRRPSLERRRCGVVSQGRKHALSRSLSCPLLFFREAKRSQSLAHVCVGIQIIWLCLFDLPWLSCQLVSI